MWLIFAALSAVAFGVRGMLYHYTSKKPLERSLLLSGVFLTGCLISLAGAVLSGDEWPATALVGIIMGICSYAANASMLKGFAVGKASLVAILTALPAVVVVVLAYVLWNEKLTPAQLLLFVVIIAGLLLVRYSRGLTLSDLQGAKWGLLAMLFFGLNDISGKWSTILEAPLFPTLFFMFLTGTLLFAATWLAERHSRAQSIPAWPLWRTFGAGMLIGTTNGVGMILILRAFELGVTGLVSAVVALNVVLILLYTRIVVKERFSSQELAGMVLAFGGVLLLHLLE